MMKKKKNKVNYRDVDIDNNGWYLYTNKENCFCSGGAAPHGYSLISAYVSQPDCLKGLTIYCEGKLNNEVSAKRGNMNKMMGKKKVWDGINKMMGKKRNANVTWYLSKGMDGNCHCLNAKPDDSKIVLGTFQKHGHCKDHIATDC
jgi:hypothetical protein